MDTASLRFPTYFPENCPPEESTDEECVLYRLCKGPVLTDGDFKSFYLINPIKYKDNIKAYGISVFKSFSDCNRAKSKSPKLRSEYKYVASGSNNSQRGKLLNTPSGVNPNHYTWWLYDGVKPHTFFRLCEGGGGINE